jgi:adenosylcobinamide-phosphate synthase
MPSPLALTAAALLVEAAFGYPDPVFRAIRHPVVWIGTLIGALDRRLPRTRAAGVLALGVVLIATASPTVALSAILPWAALVLLASTLPAQRSLAQHVGAVAHGLQAGLAEGRVAVSHIVGRDPASLDAAAVARAAIESLAENFADGVVGPAVWGCVAGLPGMALYKAINTADSMIGHRTPRHERFGWAAARLDDLVNLPASRLAALWIVLAALLMPGAHPGPALRAILRDARRHRSPNAGWPEAAMAGALGLRLAGPRVYGGVTVDGAWMGDGSADATAADITRAQRLYRLACALQIAAITAAALALQG